MLLMLLCRSSDNDDDEGNDVTAGVDVGVGVFAVFDSVVDGTCSNEVRYDDGV